MEPQARKESGRLHLYQEPLGTLQFPSGCQRVEEGGRSLRSRLESTQVLLPEPPNAILKSFSLSLAFPIILIGVLFS